MKTERELEEHAEQLAGAIYGTIVVAGLLVATGPDDDPRVAETALWIVVTMLVFWLAHSWSLTLARRVTGLAERRHELRVSLARNWPLVQSAVPPLIVMFLARALGATDETAILLAAIACVVLLAAWGVVVARQEHERPLRIAFTASACAALGALMVLLKVVIH